MLRVYTLYKQYERRRRIKAALEAAGRPNESLSIIEFELQQEQDKQTRVGQKLEGKR